MPARNAIKEGIAYDVELGASFRGGVATHHTLRYSFKPPTADYTQRGRVSINGAAVEIKVPTKSSSPVVFRGKNGSNYSRVFFGARALRSHAAGCVVLCKEWSAAGGPGSLIAGGGSTRRLFLVLGEFWPA